ncbi:MAG TPA: response regulator [Nitrososphaeraceae archaeon]|nr:response regulator [Nitrososphaeraceae archaeon]
MLLNPNQSHKSILLVDDELDIVNLFTEVFKSRNYDVFGFTNPLEALEHYKKNYDQYGIVISDIRMPEMNGFDLVKNLKKINTNILIILMSAYDNIDYSQLNDITINEFLQKPIQIKELLSTVEKCLISTKINRL